VKLEKRGILVNCCSESLVYLTGLKLISSLLISIDVGVVFSN